MCSCLSDVCLLFHTVTPALCPALLHYLDKRLFLVFNKCQTLFKKKLSLNEYGTSPSLVSCVRSMTCSGGMSPAVLWLMLSLALSNRKDRPVVVLVMGTPLVIIQSRMLTLPNQSVPCPFGNGS